MKRDVQWSFAGSLALHVALLIGLVAAYRIVRPVAAARQPILSIGLLAASDELPPPPEPPAAAELPEAPAPATAALPPLPTELLSPPAMEEEHPVEPSAIPKPLLPEPAPSTAAAETRPQRKPFPRPGEKRGPAVTGAPAATRAQTSAGGEALGQASKASPARVIFRPEPPYPASARRSKQEGVVRVRATVSAAGRVTAAQVIRSSGFPALDSAALAAVRQWRFEPARSHGVAVASEIEAPLRFQLPR